MLVLGTMLDEDDGDEVPRRDLVAWLHAIQREGCICTHGCQLDAR
jgi:hypothetical protein